MSGFQGPVWKRKLLFLCAGVAVLSLAAAAADVTFTKAHSGLAADVADLRGVACMQTVTRTRYAVRPAVRGAGCDALVAAANSPRGALEWRSRQRLDVTAAPDADTFSLKDATRFETTDVGGMIAAASATQGEFSSFLRHLIALDPAGFQPLGAQTTSIGPLSAFTFQLPFRGSTYRGSLFVTSDTADLRRVVLETDNAGEACRVQYTTDYATTRIADRYVLVPRNSTMVAIQKDGTEHVTETYFSSCRRPAPPAAPATVADPKPIPPGTRFRIRIQPSIDSATAAIGDPVTAVIRTTVKDKQKEMIVHAGDRLHGRIALIEQHLTPQPSWNIAVVFETIERGVGEGGIDQGVEQPISVAPLNAPAPPEALTLRQQNAGYFVFGGASAVLGSESEWETR